MANQLAIPTWWWSGSYNENPPSYWNGSEYVLTSPTGTSYSFEMDSDGAPPSGATFEGCITQTNDSENDLYLLLVHNGDSEWYGVHGAIQLRHGEKTSFSFTLPEGFNVGVRLLVGGAPDVTYPVYTYGLTVTLDPSCLALVAEDDNATTRSGTPVTTNVLANDTLGGEPVTLAQLSGVPVITVQPKNGTATVNADGTITYTPNKGFSGQDTYEYEIQLPEPEVCMEMHSSSGGGDNSTFYPDDVTYIPPWLDRSLPVHVVFEGYGVATYEMSENGRLDLVDGDTFYGSASGVGTVTQEGNSICLNWSIPAGY